MSTPPPATGPRVLVIDDDREIRSTLSTMLETLGAQVSGVGTGDAALAELGREPFDLAFLDLRLGDQSGLELLPELLALCPSLQVVLITAHASFDNAVDAIKRGAADYVPKPFTPAQIRHVYQKLASSKTMRSQLDTLERRLAEQVPEAELSSESPSMHATLEMASRVAAAQAPVLLRGESGTGKGVFALYIHGLSPRRERPFVTVNCPTLTDDLLASDLFGHKKGSFTGAVADQAGKVEAAEGGTLFLDEIGEISPALQAKLLRFLQTKEYERVGETKTRRADVRILAATNRDLEADVKAGTFREDLLFRLNVVEVMIPPLRERREDLVRLAKHFLAFFARTSAQRTLELSPAAEELIRGYAWPGNVRELRNVIERATILWPARVLEPAAFPSRMQGEKRVVSGIAPGGDCTIEALEREHILRILARGLSSDEAAAVLGIDASTLWRKKKKYAAE